MSCSAGKGIFLKKVHEWVLVPMSLDLNLNGRLPPATMKVKKAKESLQGANCVRKWTRKLLLLWVLVVFAFGWLWFSLDFTQEDGEAPQTLNMYFNVSNNQLLGLASVFSDSDQIVSMECTAVSRLIPGDGISCSVKVIRSEEGRGNGCTVLNRDLPLLKSRFVSHVSRFAVSATYQIFGKVQCLAIPVDSASFQCRNFCDWITGYWWVLAGVALSYKIASKFWMNKLEPASEHSNGWSQKIVHDQPLTQYQKPVYEPQLRIPPNGSGYWRKRILILIIVVGVTLSVGSFRHFNAEYNTLREETLANMCDERARMLQDQFNASMNHVHALAILVSTFHHGKHPSAIDQKTFGEYTKRTDFERPLTSGVAYALKVVHSEREQFEKERGWTIKKMETEDQTPVQDCIPENLDPAPAQDEYAPVIFSQETVSHIVSIDMMSGKEDRDNILRARATGKGVLTSPFKLLKSNHLGVVLTFAVYNNDLPLDATPDQRMDATMGYLGASYDVPSLVEKLLHQLASKETIVVNVYDTTNASSPINMYGTEFTDTGLLHVSNLDFGDPLRRHEMHCRFKQKPRLPLPAVFSSGGLFTITLLVSYIIYDAIRRLAEMEADYHTMADLKGRAEAADVAKSQFLATVSHEIRTPMNGVLGMLQMLMDTELDATQQDYAQTAHTSGNELISLMNEVLDQAKIEAGRFELEDLSFDLRAVLDNVQSLFSGKANEKGIELAVYVSSRVPDVVIGDRGRFRQIITNLVGNSIKFTIDRGHVFVTVHLADEVRSSSEATGLDSVGGGTLSKTYSTLSGYPVVNRWGSWKDFKHLSLTASNESDRVKLLITVEDTGVGIPQDVQNHIFTPFVQADSSTSRRYGGTGIGLSISKHLVELMGGEIGFVSEPGTGSTFSFTVCLRRGETGSLETKWQLCDPSISEFQGLKALVIDERTVRAEVTRYHLERLGISADVASNMESACSFISNRSSASSQLAMVLIDKDLWDNEADRSFRSLLQKQRQNGATEETTNPPKIFLLTASITAGERNTLKSTGLVDNVLAKPLRLSVLVACLQEALSNGKKRILNQKKQTTLGTLLREKRILVVDDNVVNRRVAEGALKKYGALVTCVASGKAALQKLEPPHGFHACFMDLQMPEMDGFEATERIRGKESEVNKKIESGEVSVEAYGDVAYWHTPILAMTADVVQASNDKCMRYGMDDYVSKPFDERQLYSAVARFFESG